MPLLLHSPLSRRIVPYLLSGLVAIVLAAAVTYILNKVGI